MNSTKHASTGLDISVVIPLKNEEDNIPILIPRLLDSCRKFCGNSFEVICVNDRSTDSTWDVLKKLRAEFPRFLKIYSTDAKLRQKITVGLAIKLGCENSRGKYIITMDGDLSHNPEKIGIFILEFNRGQLCVIGGRYKGKSAPFRPISRYYISRLFNFLTHLILRVPIVDLTTGFRGFRRDLLNRFKLTKIGFEFHLEINKKLAQNVPTSRISEISIKYERRGSGRSKMKYLQVFWGYFSTIFSNGWDS